jgi:hypothetical protein
MKVALFKGFALSLTPALQRIIQMTRKVLSAEMKIFDGLNP